MKMICRIACLMLAVALTFALPVVASAKMVKKVDNFILFVDHSGSMAQPFDGSDQKKIELAAQTVDRLDKAIPELGYTGAMALFAPYSSASAPATYKNGVMGSAAAGIDTNYDVFGRQTPMGDGLMSIDSTIAGFSGKTALILFTDGDSNTGSDAVAQAQALYSKYSPNLCVHVVSYADTANGQMVIEKIRDLSDCSVSADMKSLESDAGMAQFAKDVFYDEVGEQKPDPCKPDSDGDGVPDCRDKCPGTEAGLVVDETGCELKFTLQIEFDFDSDVIRPEYHHKIAKAADFVKSNPKTKVLVAGHTDSMGDADYNKQLSMRRAEALKAYMVKNFGISAGVLYPRGYGESRPVATNDTEEGRQSNRRVEFICCAVLPPE